MRYSLTHILQTYKSQPGEVLPTFRSVASTLFRDEGARGFVRGIGPRMLSTMAWGTCMSTAFETLKRVCAKPSTLEEKAAQLAGG